MIKALLALLILAQPLQALRRRDEAGLDPGKLRRSQADVQQLLFGKVVLREAKRHLGEPYLWGGKEGDKGFDCSGYTHYVFKTLGVELATNAVGQYQKGVAIEASGLVPGDLVFFSSQGAALHVGIYAGEGKFLHAPSEGKVISEESMKKSYYAGRYIGARRYSKEPTPKKETRP